MIELPRWNVQPVNLFVVCEAEDKFVDYPINSDSSADELKLSVFGVIEYEMVAVEGCKCSSFNTVGHLLSKQN